MQGSKQWYKSKSLIVGASSVLIGLLVWFQGNVDAGSVMTINGALMVLLRLVTKEAVKFTK